MHCITLFRLSLHKPPTDIISGLVCTPFEKQIALLSVDIHRVPVSLAASPHGRSLANIRYTVYGLPFLRAWRNYPWWLRWGLILGLTDETYAIICASPRHGKLQRCFVSCVVFFDIAYWCVGTVTGTLLGNHLPFSTEGIEFAMLALFVVILVDLCRKRENWRPAIVGGAGTAVVIAIAMAFFPGTANKTLLIAMAIIIAT